MLVSILVVTGLFVTLGMLALQFVISQNAASRFRVDRERAMQIAEAGVEYYRWHLAHVPEDFQDGTGAAGPYVHSYTDVTGNIIGTFSLEITPPLSGSTVVTIRSTGQITNRPTSSRTVTVQQGIPSFTKWAVVANAAMRFGAGTEVFGPIHSNGGIRFDGIAHNIVTSYLQTYTDVDFDRCTAYSWAVHTCVNPDDPAPMTALPTRTDVFIAGRQVQANFVDFNSISVDMQAMKTKASANGISVLPSGGQGYHITFRLDGTVDMRVVTAKLRCQYRSGAQWRDYGYCSNNYNLACTQNSTCSSGATCIQSSHSIGTRAGDEAAFTYQSASSLGVPLPANGLIFIEDDAWVDGVVPNGTRITLVAAKEPLASGLANIYLTRDLTYSRACSNTSLACSLDVECTGGATCVDSSNGTSAVGLITQQNILAGYFSESNLRIDAALIAQNGRVGRPNYGASGSSYQLYPTGSSLPNGGGNENSCDDFRSRSALTTFGAIATNQRYGFAWTGSTFCSSTQSSGYCSRTLNFDAQLTYAPPPDFPTTGQYETLSWEEQ